MYQWLASGMRAAYSQSVGGATVGMISGGQPKAYIQLMLWTTGKCVSFIPTANNTTHWCWYCRFLKAWLVVHHQILSCIIDGTV